MADERMVPMLKGGQPVEMAVTPRDFFHAKLSPKGTGEFETYAEAGYRLADRYEDLSEYDGPKTQRQYDREQSEKQAARAADEKATAKAEPAKAEKA